MRDEATHLQTTVQLEGEPYTLDERHKMQATELADAVGYCLKTVLEMKARGCPFFGRFSSIEILRKWEFNNPNWRKLQRKQETSEQVHLSQ